MFELDDTFLEVGIIFLSTIGGMSLVGLLIYAVMPNTPRIKMAPPPDFKAEHQQSELMAEQQLAFIRQRAEFEELLGENRKDVKNE